MIGKTRQIAAGPRGVLVPGFETGQFRHQRGAPCAALARLVEHYWYVGWDMEGLPPRVQETLPHPNVHLVVEHDSDGIYGVHTARYTKQLAGRGFAFGVKFRPGGFRPFLGRPLSAIADSRLALEELFGADGGSFAHAIRLLASDGKEAAMMDAAEAFLLARLPAPDPDAELAAALVDAIAADPAMRTVDALAQYAGLNKRTMQRLFQQYVGVGPKWVIKRYRMHEAVARLQAGKPAGLAQLALDLGYFDQAHFINDFTALVGQPPAAYARSVAEVVEAG